MDYLQITKNWIEQFVIQLNLCPFAQHPFQKGKIRFQLTQTDQVEELTQSVLEELLILFETPKTELETSILIHPNALTDFSTYNDYLEFADGLLEKAGLEGVIQIASFHPDYQYEGTTKDAVSNYVTRSPFPMLHFLRADSVEAAVASHPDPEQIPYDNIQKLESLGIDAIREILKDCFELKP